LGRIAVAAAVKPVLAGEVKRVDVAGDVEGIGALLASATTGGEGDQQGDNGQNGNRAGQFTHDGFLAKGFTKAKRLMRSIDRACRRHQRNGRIAATIHRPSPRSRPQVRAAARLSIASMPMPRSSRAAARERGAMRCGG